MSDVVYMACATTSLLCAVLLTRGYLRSRQRLLLWSSICFAWLAISNAMLVLDLSIMANGPDLSLLRLVPAVIGIGFLLYGLIWEAKWRD